MRQSKSWGNRYGGILEHLDKIRRCQTTGFVADDPVALLGRGRKNASKAGSRKTAPSMLTKNMNDSSTPMSAWNLSAEKTQLPTPIAIVTAVNAAAAPRSTSARYYASRNDCPSCR